MECRDVTDRMVLFVYGDLSDAESAAISSHLSGCASCAERRERIESVRAGLGAFAPIEAPADVAAIAAWARESSSRRSVPRHRAVLVGIAAGFLVFFSCAAFGTRFERSARGFVITFGKVDVEPIDSDARVVAAMDRIEELQRAWLVAQDERYADVLNVLRVESERQRIRDSLQAQEIFDGVVQAVSFPPPRPHRP